MRGLISAIRSTTSLKVAAVVLAGCLALLLHSAMWAQDATSASETGNENTPVSQSFLVRAGNLKEDYFIPKSRRALTAPKLRTAVRRALANHRQSVEVTFDSATPGDNGEVRVQDINVPVGCYRLMLRWEPGYTGSCIRRNGWHLNFHLRNGCGNYDVFNVHVVPWWENGPQIGIYNSANGWCAQSRGTWTDMRDNFLRMALAAGLGYGVAVTVANTMATLSVAALAL